MNAERLTDIGLLVLRAGAGLMMAGAHGWPKLLDFGALSGRFPDPIGIGSFLSALLATGAEFFGSALLIAGLGTRYASGALLVTMLVAGLIQHAADPFQKKELALLYALVYATLIFTGAGRLSIDHKFLRR